MDILGLLLFYLLLVDLRLELLDDVLGILKCQPDCQDTGSGRSKIHLDEQKHVYTIDNHSRLLIAFR